MDYDSDNDNLIEIANLAQLNAVRWDVDGDGSPDSGSYAAAFPLALPNMGCSTTCAGYELTADLDFDTNRNGRADAGDAYWNSGSGWGPIGTLTSGPSSPYTAKFHGNGHTISNLLINRATAEVGLFGVLGGSGFVHHVGLLNANVTSTMNNAGALVGFMQGASTRVAASYVDGGAVTGALYTGGIVGSAQGQVAAVWTNVTMSGNSQAGGLVGSNAGGVKNSYALGTASGTGGLIHGVVGASSSLTALEAVYYNSDIHQVTDSPYSRYTAELQGGDGYTGIYATWNVDVDGVAGVDNPWDFGTGREYPALKADRNNDGTFTWQEFGRQGRAASESDRPQTTDYDTDNDNLIEVSTLAQLNVMRYDLDGDGIVKAYMKLAAETAQLTLAQAVAKYLAAFPNADIGGNYRMGCPATCVGYELIEDLDFDTNGNNTGDAADAPGVYDANNSGWSPIHSNDSCYTATFEGNYHSISHLFINESDRIGLFGHLAGGEIRNVGLLDVNITASSVDNGTLVAYNGACTSPVAGGGTITNSYATGTLNCGGGSKCGGLVGSNTGTVRTSWANVAVTNTGNDNGGLIGHNTGSITASYAIGSNTATGSRNGGLDGSGAGSVTNSYFNNQITAQFHRVQGKTTAQLQNPTGYTGIYANWNLDLNGDGTADDPWHFGTSSQYPIHKGVFLAASTITITADSPSVVEGQNAVFTVAADPMPESDLTVNLAQVVRNNCATIVCDAAATTTATTPSVTITGGQPSVKHSVPTEDDAADEHNGSVTLTTAEGTSPATVTVTDNDAPPSFQFQEADGRSTETFGRIPVNVEMTPNVQYKSGVSVNWAITADAPPNEIVRATEGLDFTTSSGTLAFPPHVPGQDAVRYRSFNFILVNDVFDEADEEDVYIALSIPPGVDATIGNRSRMLLRITDEDIAQPQLAPAVVKEGSGALRATWTVPPNTAADAFSGYNVQYRLAAGVVDDDTPAWTGGPQDVLALTAVIDGLDANTEYQARVAPVRLKSVARTWSAIGAGTTGALPPGVPGAPGAPTFTAPTTDGWTAAWTAPTDTGDSAVTGYDLRYRVAGSGVLFTDGPQALTIRTATITGLEPNTAYEVQARAVNTQGGGAWSASGYAATTVDGAIFSGTMIVRTRIANSITEWGYVIVEYGSLTPFTFNDGARDRSFVAVIDVEPENRLAVEFNNRPPPSSLPGSYILRLDNASFLLDSASYGSNPQAPGLYVFPNANIGWSDGQAVAVSLVPVFDASAAPTFGTPTASSLVVNWVEPSNTGGSAITNYDLQYRPANSGAAFTAGPQDLTGTTATIVSLSANTAYEVQARAANAAGVSSAWSDSGYGATTVDDAIFSGLMTVGESIGTFGYNSSAVIGALEPASFTVNGNLYTIVDASYRTNTFSFATTSAASSAPAFTLHLDGSQIHLLAANKVGTKISLTIANAGQSWVVGQKVAVSLVLAPVPVVTITAGPPVTEGANAAFTVTATPAPPAAALTVILNVTATGNYGVTTGLDLATIPANQQTVTHTVATTGDSVGEAHGSVTVTVTTGNNYTIGDPDAATVTVLDDDNLIEVSNLAQLNAMRWDVDGNGVASSGNEAAYAAAFPTAAPCAAISTCAGYALTADLDFDTDGSGTANAGDDYWNAGAGWVPIVNYATEFSGNGHTISNLFINRPSWERVGLFHALTGSSYVHHVGLLDANVTAGPRTGALVGEITLNARVAGGVDGGAVTGSGQYAGGLVGILFGRIDAAWADVSVTRTDTEGTHGGLVGLIRGSDQYVKRPNEGSLRAAYSLGPVTSSSDSTGNVGGVYGVLFTSGTAADVYFDSTTSGETRGGTSKTTAQLQAPTGYTGIYATWDLDLDGDGTNDSPWDFGTAGQYPALKADRNGDDVFTWEEFGDQGRGAPVVTITAGSAVTEGTAATFTVTADPAPPANLTVNLNIFATGSYGVTTGPATATIPANAQTATHTVATTSDKVFEDPGSVTATVTVGAGYTIGDPAAATVTINDGLSFSIDDVSMNEGDSGMTPFVFTVTASLPVVTTETFVPVDYQVGVRLLTATAGVDYVAAASDTLRFYPGDTFKQFTIQVYGDTVSELDETFVIGISSTLPTSDGEGIGTILNDDRVPGDMDYDMDDDNLIEVSSLAQLNAIRWNLNGSGAVTGANEDAYFTAFTDALPDMGCAATCIGYELTANLDFDTNNDGSTDVAGDDYWNGGLGWLPIGGGAGEGGYTATFDGGYRLISNLYIDRNRSNLGLFGRIDGNAVIRNLGLIDVSISSATTSLSYRVGALIGLLAGGEAARVYATGDINTDVSDGVGGLVGTLHGTLRASYADVNVRGYGATGGLVGDISGQTLSIFSEGVLSASYSLGDIESSQTANSNKGGLYGSNVNWGGGTIQDSYFDGSAQRPSGSHAAGMQSTAALQSPAGYTGLYAAWNLDLDGDSTMDNPWDFGEDDQYPALKGDSNNDGTFTWHEFGDQGRVDHPDVSITANQPVVTEGQPARFTVSITPASATAVTVNLLVAAHLDYGVAVGPATVVIPANAPSAVYTVTTTNNDVDQHAGRVIVTVRPGSGYDATASSATITINDNDERGVTISRSCVTVAEAGGTAQYTVVLTSEPTANVTVTPSVTGPATFSPVSLAFTTGNWNAAQTVTVTGQDDDVDNTGNQRTASITHAVSGGDYGSVTAAAVAVTVIDDEGPQPVVSITANRTSVTEGLPIVFTITITGDQAPGGDVPVSLRVVVADDNGGGGTTTQTATIPANGLRGTLTVTTMDDELDETGSSVTVTVVNGAGYTVGSPATVTVAVNDNDLSGVSIEAVNSLNGPGGAAEFRLTATTVQERALNVRVRITSTGVTGVSRNRTVTVTIPRGRATAVYSIAIPENSPDGTVTATLQRGSGYTIDPAPATVAIVDRSLIARPSFEAGKPAVTTRESVSRPGEIALHIAPGRNPNSEHASSLRYEWTQVSGPASTFLQGSIYRDGNSIDGSQRFRGGELYYPVTQSGDVVIYRVSGCDTMRTVTVPAGTALVNTQGVTITEANEVVYEVLKPDNLKGTPQFRVNSPGGAFHWWRFVHDQDDDGEWIAVAVSGGIYSSSILTRHGTLGRISERFCKTDAQGRKVGASPTGDYVFRLTAWDQAGASHFAVITATVTDTLPPVAAAKVTSVYQAARDSQLLCSTEPDAPIRCGNSDTPDTLDTSNLVQEPGSTVRLSGRDSRTNVGGRLSYS